jgi:FMN phosphatase YigB (HAD superfamily)
MTTAPSIVFLLDIDNTLLDNDRFGADLGTKLTEWFGADERKRWQAIDMGLREEFGFADYLGTLQRFRTGLEDHPRLLEMGQFLLGYPFDECVYPGTMPALAHLRELGTPVVLSDGDAVFQPRKAAVSGVAKGVEGRLLIYVHKEAMLDSVLSRYPADHYVMIDDKLRLLVAIKARWGDKVTTVFVRQGHYAAASGDLLASSPPDLIVDDIGELASLSRDAFLGVRATRPA